MHAEAAPTPKAWPAQDAVGHAVPVPMQVLATLGVISAATTVRPLECWDRTLNTDGWSQRKREEREKKRRDPEGKPNTPAGRESKDDMTAV